MYRGIRGFEGDEVYRFTSSIGHDPNIYREVATVISAHALHLRERGLIPEEAWERIRGALLGLIHTVPGEVLKPGYEDVFEAIEAWLRERIGDDSGWIWLGRSRNDHVAAALRLYTLRTGYRIMEAVALLRVRLLEKAMEHGGVLLPGFTHGQASQVHDAGCLLLAYEEAMEEVYRLMEASLAPSTKSPLGAGAGAGSAAPLDEGRLAGLLGFTSVYASPYYASGSRLFLEAFLASLALLGVEASRIAEDLIALAELGIARLPPGHVATSSIMPHKENPATLEIVRALGSRLLGYAQAGLAVPLKLRYSYNLDLQEANPILYAAAGDAMLTAEAMASLVDGLSFDPERTLEAIRSLMPWSSELAEVIAMREGIPLRRAYTIVAQAVGEGRMEELSRRYGVGPESLRGLRGTGCSGERIERLLRSRLEAARMDLEEARRRAGRVEELPGRVATLLRGQA